MSNHLRPTNEIRAYVDDGPSRATIKLVYEAVAAASRENRAYNQGIEGSLSRLENLPVLVGQLVERVDGTSARLAGMEAALADLRDLPHRVKTLEDAERSDTEYRRVHLPTLAVSVGGLILAIVGLLFAH